MNLMSRLLTYFDNESANTDEGTTSAPTKVNTISDLVDPVGEPVSV